MAPARRRSAPAGGHRVRRVTRSQQAPWRLRRMSFPPHAVRGASPAARTSRMHHGGLPRDQCRSDATDRCVRELSRTRQHREAHHAASRSAVVGAHGVRSRTTSPREGWCRRAVHRLPHRSLERYCDDDRGPGQADLRAVPRRNDRVQVDRHDMYALPSRPHDLRCKARPLACVGWANAEAHARRARPRNSR